MKCTYCGNVFVQMAQNQKFCNKKCSAAHWNRRSKRIPAGLTVEQRLHIDALVEKYMQENKSQMAVAAS